MPKASGSKSATQNEFLELKHTRKVICNRLSRFSTFLQTQDAKSFETVDVYQVETRLKSVEEDFLDFDRAQTRLEFIVEDEQENRLETESLFYREISKAKKLITQYNKHLEKIENEAQYIELSGSSRDAPAHVGRVSEISAATAGSGALLPNVAAKLPQLSLPEFNGSYSDWQRFRDMFKAIVHNNSGLSNVQRFYYLEAALKGEPKNIIAALAPTDANYTTAWELLEKRYENKKIMINSYLKEIMNMPVVGKESHVELRQLSNTFFKNYRCLESLGENVNSWDTILIYILISKLDTHTKREWEIFSKDKSSPTIKDFNDFLTQRCQILEASDSKTTLNNISSSKKFPDSRSLVTTDNTAHVNNNNYRPKCCYCKEAHFIYFCEKFKGLSVSERFNQTKKAGLCTNCLRQGHKTVDCRSQGCKICKLKHATLLHQTRDTSNKNFESNTETSTRNFNRSENHNSKNSDNTNTNRNSNNTEVMSNTIMSNYSINNEPYTLLSTAIVNVFDSQNKIIPCRVLLDSGSQSNFVTQDIVDRLNLRTNKINLPVSGVGQIKTNINKQVFIQLSSTNKSFKTKLSFLVINKITDLIPHNKFDIIKLNIPEEIILADPTFNVPSNIDMLIGASVFFELLSIGQIKLGKNLPILQKTLLGWIITGNLSTNLVQSNTLVSQCLFTNSTLEQQIEKFWHIEEVSTDSNKIKWSQEELDCENNFISTLSRNKDGRFVVKLPLKENVENLGESKNTALNRLYSVERKLKSRPELKEQYQSFMLEYEQLGHMTQISRNLKSDTPVYYMPHHCIERPGSLTTKVRVVFDASCKSTTNLSLNDVLKIGPVIQFDLFIHLLRFRQHNYVLIGDLTKMYRNIMVHDEQKNLQRIVWRNNPDEPVKYFLLNTLTYGTSPASYIATRCLKQIAIEKRNDYPLECKIIESDFYMDDLLTGACSSEELSKVCEKIKIILLEYGFEIRKFQSNCQNLLKNLDQSNDSQYLITDDNSTKTLGISWIPSIDSFKYTGQQLIPSTNNVTKRSILSFIAKIFDPLGLLGPIVICAKEILQKLWKLKINWDESIPQDLYTKWLKFRQQISDIKSIHIPRHVLVKNPVNIQIHAFCDASETSYGCAIYLRSVDQNGEIKCSLLCAKSRVAPLKTVTIPRLELLGALLLSRLIAKCVKFLDIKLDSIYLYTDSQIVLQWLSCEPKTWQNFVANRVSEIQTLTNVENWHYINSAQNPADIISRGLNMSELINRTLWWHGPEFLLEPLDNWPRNTHASNFSRKPTSAPEFRQPKLQSHVSFINSTDDDFIFNCYSTFSKLRRIIALCFRFLNNIKTNLELKNTEKSVNKKQIGFLTHEELISSTEFLVKLSQKEAFSDEISSLAKNKEINRNSKLKSLSPFLDENKVLRVGGRLKNSKLTHNSKFPMLLPAKHKLTDLIIEYEHKRTLHSGAQCTLAHVRQNFWPLNGKQRVRSLIRKCVQCWKVNPCNNLIPKMGDLPDTRVIPSRPFSSIAIDYAGPFDLRDGKLRTNKTIKAYVCIFVCQAVKAVHIEVISDLTSDGFLSLLKRFVARRGIPANIYTDNATCFVGSKNELIKIRNLTETDSFQDYLSNVNIKWHFMPARSPHFGGLHEAAVKSCKHCLKRVMNQTRLHYEEFYTLTTQVEGILNSRPLIPSSSDPNDYEVLTPAHFLIGQTLTAVPERNWSDAKVNFIKRYRHLQMIGQHFWARWQMEYLTTLQQRTKWQFHDDPEFYVGRLVLLKEENVPPMSWPLGRILQCHPGRDNVTRVVTVQAKNGTFKRAVARLCLMPIEVE